MRPIDEPSDTEQALDAAERATAMADRYATALEAISQAINLAASPQAAVTRVRLILAGLDQEATHG